MPENWFISTTVKIALNYDNNCTNDKAGFVDITASNAIQRHTGDVTNRPSFKKKTDIKKYYSNNQDLTSYKLLGSNFSLGHTFRW